MYSALGYLSSALLGLLILPAVLRIANKKLLKNDPNVKSVVRSLKKVHPLLGGLLAVIAIVHGYLALGGLRLHTGSLVYGAILIAICFGGAFSAKKKKVFLTLHKSFVLLALVMWSVHILFPSALYYLLQWIG
ncbi:MAG: hypothetical protein Q4D77_03920 [Peptostreptococcaceae bacterium]|nr:hypothetical protein [Peptostreptococcaceae bacterium]